eukprot:279144_1
MSYDSLLYYDGIIYDSTDFHQKIFSGMKALWTVIKIALMSLCVCYNFDKNNKGCLWIVCKLWYIILYCIAFILAVIIIPIIFLIVSLWIIITCSADYILCHHKKLMGEDDIKLLAIPTLLLGSDTDKLNPIHKSLGWMNDKRNNIENKLLLEDTTLLNAGYDKQFIKDSNRHVQFEESEHVKHYLMYPEQYQQEINKFLDLCLTGFLKNEP